LHNSGVISEEESLFESSRNSYMKSALTNKNNSNKDKESGLKVKNDLNKDL